MGLNGADGVDVFIHVIVCCLVLFILGFLGNEYPEFGKLKITHRYAIQTDTNY